MILLFGAGDLLDSIDLLSGKHLENPDPRHVWEKGVPLEDAWLDVKDRVGLRAYQQIQSDEARGVYRKMRWREIMEALASGKHLAVGIKVLPADNAPLEIIPNHLFSFDSIIKWESSTLEISNLKYVQIKIMKFRKTRNNLRSSVKINDSYSFEIKRQKKSGPIAMNNVIRDLYLRMTDEGRLKNCKTIKAIWQKMLPILSKNNINCPTGRGFSYASVARALQGLRDSSSKG